MQQDKLISIAMCTYNGEKFIQEQIESILNQSYKNIELIITDDCSNDTTVEVIKQYIQNDNRIKLYQNEKNLGFIKNFEKAISFCNGDYIALSDQDDIWKLNKIEKFVNEIKKNVLIYSNALLINQESQEIRKELFSDTNKLCKGKVNNSFLLDNVVSGNTMMFKKELVKYILPIPSQINYHDFWIGFVASTYGTITYTDESMTYYRRHSEQVTNRTKKKHDNYLQKLKYKKETMIQQYKRKADILEAFKSLEILKNTKTIEIIDSLIWHFKNHHNIYFNTNLYKLLNENAEEVFTSTSPNKRKKQILRYSCGLKLHTLTLFRI
jgi:glycosyltransferase involved in cell wall biosynthesis